MRLRARLLLLIGAALFPAVGVQVHYEREARVARQAADRVEALRLVSLVAADLESVVEGARQFLTAAANLDAVTDSDEAACNRTLTAISRDVPRYATFSVVDAAGRLACSSTPGEVGTDASRRAWFRHLPDSGGFAIGDYVAGGGTGHGSLHLAVALRAERHGRDGAVVTALDLGWLAQRLSQVPLPAGGAVIVADRNGTVLARWPEPGRYVGQAMGRDRLGQLQPNAFTTVLGPGMDGIHRILAFGPLGSAPQRLIIAVGLDPAPAEAALAAANQRALLLLGAGGLAAIGFGLFAARRFMERPVEALAEAMERWRAGDRTARAGQDPRLRHASRGSEFGRIAAAFDQAAAAVEAREAALLQSEARFRQIAEAVDDVFYVAEPERRRVIYLSPAFERLFGIPTTAVYAATEAWLTVVHPDDLERVRAQIAPRSAAEFDIEYRLHRPDGAEAWVRHRRFPVQGGSRRVVGVVSDITAAREASERQMLLAREVDHRAKNVLAVVQSILRLTRADSPRAFATAVEGRVAALARAHELLARGRWIGTDLPDLLRQELAPYTERAKPSLRGHQRCVLDGPALLLRTEAVQPLAMMVHELATNSAKHGALSVPRGVVRISWELEPTGLEGRLSLRLRWEESGGPAIEGPPQRLGFGSRVIASTVERQLGGLVRYEWAPAGLCCEVLIAAARLVPGDGTGPEAPAAPPLAAVRHPVAEDTAPQPLPAEDEAALG